MRLRFRRRNRLLHRELETDRFVLRPLGFWEAASDPGDWRHHPEILNSIYFRNRPMDLVTWVKVGPMPNGVDRFLFAIVPKGTDTPIGYHGIRPSGYRSANNTVGLHDRAWWGKNVVVEVRARLMNHFFEHGGIERFTGRVDTRNHGSIFNYHKLGYTHVGTQHRQRRDEVTGQLLDFLFFEIFKDEWMQGPYARTEQ